MHFLVRKGAKKAVPPVDGGDGWGGGRVASRNIDIQNNQPTKMG